ncbi:hypothetical protein lerEdw1_009808 [Lerista edwardsae]|nr:hypothetical protein lerEdw1_009808 [Lerista edwardsae]
MVDGAIVNLPINLGRGDTVIYQHGMRTILQTRFGLTVSYGPAQGLSVTLPPEYTGQTCGLCGDFNGVAADDLLPRGHSSSEDIFHFAASWKSGASPGCDDDSPDASPACPEGEQLAQAKLKCWIVQDPNGPFASCHLRISPEPYLSDCVFDLCVSRGDSGTLCRSIETYAAACQRSNCPKHSHYELCGNPRQGLCSRTWLQNISEPTCSEGCFCDDGYLWSSRKCVPSKQCGCEHDGRYYQVGEHVWLPGCTEKCICDPHGKFRCFAATCDPTQRCTLKAGRLGCHSQLTTCVVTGDPHYFTFDGAVVHFQGICDYEVSHTCNSSLDFSFRIVAANRHFRNPRVSFVYRVEIWVWTSRSRAHIVLERGKPAHINGRRTHLPAQVGSLAIVLRQRNMLTVKAKANIEIQFNGASSLFIRVGPEYQNQLCGLCKNGTTDLIPCPRQKEFQQLCAILLDNAGPFSECHWHENPEPYYKACVYDLCQYGLGNRMLCGAIEAYDEMCAIVGLNVPNWRRAMGCSFICPANNYYDFCGTACPASCAKLNAPAHCTKPCVAGCFCREGYVLNAGTCVPLSQCGCTLNGRYYQLGAEVILTDTCGKRCTCRRPARTMECQEYACGVLEMCKVVDERRGCYPMMFGTMWAYGDSHYVTYDGAVFDHQGACRYTLSRYCGPPGKLPGFTVKVLNAHNGSIAVTQPRLVELKVYGQQITMAAGQYGKIQANGVWLNLPLLLDSEKVYAYYRGSSAIVQTDFGLAVAYDWSDYVSVSVPEAYSGSLCGLGGDFNGNQYDDFRMPNGSLVHDTVTFSQSWKDPQSPFHCMAVEPVATCNKTQLAQYRSQISCGVISDVNGPLKDCDSPAAALVHSETCVRDMCRNQGNHKTLCEALRSYAQCCQARGINIRPWRAIVGCELTCPPNSRYVLCGSPCPASCAQPDGPKRCQPACLEGCQCEPGFVLSGTDCVPPKQCGCSDQGRYYLDGETFFREGGHCKKMFFCNGSIHAIEAVGYSCGSGQLCGLQKGVYGCHRQSAATCRVFGFLHYTTFAGQQYSFRGMARYILAERRGESKSLPSFRVEVKNEKQPSHPFSEILEVLVLVNNTQIHLQRGLRGTVKINGVLVNLPVRIRQLGVTVFEQGFYVVIKMDFGLMVSYDLAHSLILRLPAKYQSQTCGLCGNITGGTGDVFPMRNGSTVEEALNFVKVWGTTFPAGVEDSVVSSTAFVDGARLLRSKSMCWIIQSPSGPFASCHSQVDPQPYLTDCVVALYISAGDTDILCQSIQTYVSACQTANVTLRPWRQGTFCRSNCQANSHYELCGSPCQNLCSHSSMESYCGHTCSEGCFCNRGYLRSGGTCIPEEQCGCRHQGHYYKIGDRIWLAGCHERCRCEGPSDFRCAPATCPPGQQCVVKDGRRGCHGQLTTCTVTGDPHYFTFDGAVAHFQGTCAYEVSRTCRTASPFSFQVVAENRNRGRARVSFVSRVEIWMSSEKLDFHIAIDGQVVEVNQRRVQQLPFSLGPLANITRIHNMVTVKTAANVEIQYNGHHTLFIHVGQEYQGKLCGMCGNFNSIRGDDKILPDGSRAQNDSQFGNAWKTDPSPVGCTDDTARLQPCSNSQEYEELCGALIRPSGPFAECHWQLDPDPFYAACLYDLCHYGTAHGMLCMALGAYEELCILQGVRTGAWRAAAQCYYRLTCASSASSLSAVSLSRCLLFADGFPAEGLHLVDPTCRGTLVGDRLVFYFETARMTCGTTAEVLLHPFQVNATHAIYSNMVQGHVEKTYGGVISRDHFLFLSFSCAYPLNVNLSMTSVIHPIQDIINATLPPGQGSYQTVVTLYRDPQYSQPFAGRPILLPVNHRAYVGIRILAADPTQFVVTLSSCWATPDRDPSSSIRWDLIANQCPNAQDSTVVIEEDGVSLVGRFSFRVFMFIPDLEELYLHCRIRLCHFLTANCTVNCDWPGSALAGRRSPSGIITTGPFLRYDNALDQAKRTPASYTAH